MRRITIQDSNQKRKQGKSNTKRFAFVILLFLLIISLVSGCDGSLVLLSPELATFPPTKITPKPTTTLLPGIKSTSQVIVATSTQSPDLPPATSAAISTEILNTPTTPASRFSSKLNLTSTSDLLYISEGLLMRWDHMTGYTGSLVNRVIDYAASEDGNQVAMLRTRGITANGLALYDLAMLNFETKQVQTLIENTSRLDELSISPDGQWIAYINPNQGNRVFALTIASPELLYELGTCTPANNDSRNQMRWSPDNKAIMWSDRRGIWISQLEQPMARMVQSNHVKISDPQGESVVMDVQFHDLDWSPNGRYILAQTIPEGSQIRWYTIIDTKLDRLVKVPDSYEDETYGSPTIWLKDGSLLTSQVSTIDNTQELSLKRWFIVDTHDKILADSQTFRLSTNSLAPIEQNNEGTVYVIDWLSQMEDGSIFLNVSLPGVSLTSTILSLNLEEGVFEKLIELPTSPSAILAAPDGGGVLIQGADSQLFFISPIGGGQQNLRPALGIDAYNFNWLPPAPRS